MVNPVPKVKNITSDEFLHLMRAAMLSTIWTGTHPLKRCKAEFILDNWEVFDGPRIKFEIDTHGVDYYYPKKCNFRNFGMDEYNCRDMYKYIDDALGVPISWDVNSCDLPLPPLPLRPGGVVRTNLGMFFNEMTAKLKDHGIVFLENKTRNNPNEEAREKPKRDTQQQAEVPPRDTSSEEGPIIKISPHAIVKVAPNANDVTLGEGQTHHQRGGWEPLRDQTQQSSGEGYARLVGEREKRTRTAEERRAASKSSSGQGQAQG